MASSLVMDKKPPEISMERIEIDILCLAMIPIRITPFCTPFGFTNTEPIGCLVADTFKPCPHENGDWQYQQMSQPERGDGRRWFPSHLTNV